MITLSYNLLRKNWKLQIDIYLLTYRNFPALTLEIFLNVSAWRDFEKFLVEGTIDY